VLKTFNYLKNRLMEASTWAGLGGVFVAAAAAGYPKLIIGSFICGAIAIMTPDYTPNAPK
jgi:hypothetical protein